MSSILVVNAAGPETRVALVENGTISEFYLERKKDKGIVGNIYKGKVVRVLPGMQAAFVDIGLEKAAFLYVGDVAGGPDFSEEFELAETPEGEHGDAPPGEVPAEDTADRPLTPVPAAEAVEEGDTPSEPVSEGQETSSEADAAAAAAGEAASRSDSAVEMQAAIAQTAPTDPTDKSDRSVASAVDAVAANGAAGSLDSAVPDAGGAAADSPAPSRPVAALGPDAQTGRLRAKALEPLARRRRRLDAPRTKAARVEKGAQIQDLLKEGQEVIVQVVKDPIGTKGARVTCHISLPGRHLVFMPTVDHVGISRRVDNEKERRRLRELVEGLRPNGTGFIVRTVADGVEKDKLVADIKFLLGLWNEMARKKDHLRAPALLHPDLDLILRSIRDLFSAEVEKLVIDDRAEFERITEFVRENVPQLERAIELYDGTEPIFDAYGIEQELQRALQRKVWLKSGGYLVLDQAEALVAVDVNSGRFVGKKNLEETITAINIEAAKEIVYQLRLRNVGGIIIIDFIDMEKQQNRDKVLKALQEALLKDRAKTNVVKISELGLVEMTRKRVRESVGRLLHEPCQVCEGKGYLKSKTTVAYEIFREIQREATGRREDTLVVNCHPEVAKLLQTEERESLRNLMMRWNRTVVVKPAPTFHQEHFELQARWSRREQPPAKHAETPTAAGPAPAGSAAPGEAQAQPPGETAAAHPDGAPGATAAAPQGRRRRHRRRGRGSTEQAPVPGSSTAPAKPGEG